MDTEGRRRGSRETDLPESILAELLDAVECDGEAALRRFAAERPELADRVRTIVQRLADVGMLREQPLWGRFRLEELIGRGAMGEVWRARDPVLGREVAIKRIASHLDGSERARERFRREAQAIARLRHPSVVTVYEIGEQDEVPFLVMELIDGGTLYEVLHGAGGRRQLTELEACRLGADLCAALQAAHEAGIVHRDVKPGNVLIRASGAPLLSDFGLARLAGDAAVTRHGEFVGTPTYAAPELLTGGAASAAGDVYSLAATLHECVVGRPPFVAGTALEVAALAVRGEVPPLRRSCPRLTRDFEAVLMRALDRDPARRYPSAAAFGDDLTRIARGEPVRARRVGALGKGWRWLRRRPTLAAAIGLPVLLLMVFALVFVVWQRAELQRYERLADTRVIGSLREQLKTLWPADETAVPSLESWLVRAEDLLRRGELHRADRDRLAQVLSTARNVVPGAAPDEAAAWQHSVLVDLCAAVDAFVPTVAAARFRLQTARSLRLDTATGEEAASAWDRAREAIRSSPLYGGMLLTPQLGLLPLGPNDSGLWEFWHPASGARPMAAPDGAASRWVIAADTGMVFVLIPGGRRTVGMLPPTPERPLGSPYVAEGMTKSGLLASDVELQPYFLSKFEVTQAQYERLTGDRPSHFATMPESATQPVESVSWQDLHAVLEPMGLRLPTDAQWEVAHRCGTTTVYPTGDARESLVGLDNVLDRTHQREQGGPGSSVDPVEDGFAGPNPVDAFAPNAWGLHGMIGNVAELCADALDAKEKSRRPGDGLFGTSGRFVALRGSSWGFPSWLAYSGLTDAGTSDRRSNAVGFRPVLQVRRLQDSGR